MKISIMQPYFFPYLGYFQLVSEVDKFLFYDDVNYIKKCWINRNYILSNGEKHLLSIPLESPSQNRKIFETFIFQDSKKISKILMTLGHAYGKAPFFEDVFPLVKELFGQTTESISDFNISAIQSICRYLDIPTVFERTSNQNSFSHLKGEQRILEICKKNFASVYINPIGGVELYKKENFQDFGIRLEFLNPNLKPYFQYRNAFVPNLSIIDVLMFNSKEEVQNRLRNFELV